MQKGKIYDSNWPHCSGIYCITNTKNNKKYIGSAIDLFKRLRRHNRELIYDYHYNQHLMNAYKKYSKEIFEVSIEEMFENIDYDQLLKIEDQYIKKYNSSDPNYGYNIKENSHSFPELSENSVKIRKEKHDKRKLKVMCFNYKTGEFYKEFNSVTEASSFFNTSTSNISKSCKGLINYLKGYTFCYSVDYDNSKDYRFMKKKRDIPQSERELRSKNCFRSTRVYEYNSVGKLLHVYNSKSDCERKLGLNKEKLRNSFKNGPIKMNNKLYSNPYPINLDDFEEIWNNK